MKVAGTLFITPHAAVRALSRGITLSMICKAVRNGKCTLIWPSCVYRYSAKLHGRVKIVVILDRSRRIVITCYKGKQPKPGWQ